MKFLMILFAFFTLACGKMVVDKSGNSLGTSRALSMKSPLTSFDQNNLTSVCNALTQKVAILPSVVNSVLEFSTNQKDCLGNATPEASVQVGIHSNGSGYIFKRKSNNQDFIFPDVETPSSGALADVCSSLNSFQNPLISGSHASYFTTSGILASNCRPVEGEICVQIERASQEGNSFVVHTQEWLRIRVSSTRNEKIGFFTERRKITRGFCGLDQKLEFQATLK